MKEQDYINTFISGVIILKIGSQYVFVKNPSAEDKTFADFLSYEFYQDCLIEGVMTQEDANEFLIQKKLWHPDKDDQLKNLQENVENMQVDYFNSFYNSTAKKYIKSNIENVNKKIEQLYEQKFLLHDKTCEYLQDYFSTCYLLENYCFLRNGALAIQEITLRKLVDKYRTAHNNIYKSIRSTAKSSEWRNRWISTKADIFTCNPSDLNDCQCVIINWSHYYDGVYESYERPSPEVIMDDIALDGWSVLQKRKREQEERQNKVDNAISDNQKNAGEIFIPAKTQEEVKEILDLNTAEGKAKLKSLSSDLKKKGTVSASELTSTRREIQMQSNRQASERRKNRG